MSNLLFVNRTYTQANEWNTVASDGKITLKTQDEIYSPMATTIESDVMVGVSSFYVTYGRGGTDATQNLPVVFLGYGIENNFTVSGNKLTFTPYLQLYGEVPTVAFNPNAAIDSLDLLLTVSVVLKYVEVL